jgi:hypothetical protein
MKTLDLFPVDYTKDKFFEESYKPVALLSKLFGGCKERYDLFAKDAKANIRRNFDIYINEQLSNIRSEITKAKPSKVKLRGLIFNIKNAVETMPYTVATKQTTYVYIKKELLPIFSGILSEEQLLILYDLNCLTIKEEIARRMKKEAKKNLDRIVPINITDEFIEKVYKPTSIELITSNTLTNVVIGMMMITGRRPSEVVQSMELDFSTYSETGYVGFSGQKKKSTYFKESGYDKLDIPLLMNKEYFLLFKERYGYLKELVKYTFAKGKTVTELNPRDFSNWSGCIRNAYTKRLPQITSIMSKTLYRIRSVYACYMLENDNKKNMSPTAYICNILGHGDDDRTNLNYEKICYSRSGNTTPVKEKTKKQVQKLEKTRDSFNAFVSRKLFNFAPSSILPCQSSVNKNKTIKGYSFFLCIGKTESESLVSVYLPLKCKTGDKIKALVITDKNKDEIDWVYGENGLCELILKKYVPDFEFKKTKKQRKLEKINDAFELEDEDNKPKYAFVNKAKYTYAPRTDYTCKEATYEPKKLENFVFYFSYGVDEKDPYYSVFYPEDATRGDVMDVLILDRNGDKIKTIPWVIGEYGLCRLISRFYGSKRPEPNKKDKKTKKEN